MSLSIEDASIHRNGSAGENPTPDLLKSESDRIKTFYQTVGLASMAFIVAALSSYKDTKDLYLTTNHSLLIAGGFLVFMTFLCVIILMMFDIVLHQHGRRWQGRRWYPVLNILVVVTSAMLIVADTILVIVTKRNNMVLSVLVILVPVLALISVVARAGAWMGEQPSPTLGSRFESFPSRFFFLM